MPPRSRRGGEGGNRARIESRSPALLTGCTHTIVRRREPRVNTPESIAPSANEVSHVRARRAELAADGDPGELGNRLSTKIGAGERTPLRSINRPAILDRPEQLS